VKTPIQKFSMQMIVRPTTSRIPALDFTKGTLVLIMVFYHWLNYFIGINIDYRYLRFLTPSFIFISGFLIGHIYLSKHTAVYSEVSKRLFTRGAKLLLIFIVLNVGRAILIANLPSGVAVIDQINLKTLWTIFVVGDVPITGYKVAAFYILIPIAYLLVLSAGLVSLYKYFAYTFHVVCTLLLLSVVGLWLSGLRSPNVELMTIGLMGALVGFVPVARINSFVRHPYLFSLSYLFYVVAITVWNVPFVLLAVGVFLSVWGIYFMGLSDAAPGGMRRHIILLGKHSLFGYVAQIAILQVLSATLRHVDARLGVIGISLMAAFALTMAAVEGVERVKRKSVILDRLYKVAFA